ncbi:MAG: chaperone protein ClpB, partial [Myxococcales bacterium]|nr:chaperone protein ClpB [Myxococcales bacterium]
MTALTLRLESYAPDARVLVQSAQALADARKHAEVTPAHVFYRLVEESDAVGDALRRAGVDPVDVLVELEAAIRKTPGANDNVAYLSPRTLELLGRAEAEASRARGAPVGVLELLLASAQELDGPVRDVLRFTGLSAPLVRAAVDTVRATGGRHGAANAIAGTVPSLIEGSPATPKAIAEFSVDWTHLAARGELGPTIGRDAELRRMVQVLARHHENNPLLVGEPGIGKRSIVRQLALRMAHGDVPTLLSGKRLVALDLGALVAGARLRGQLEERVKAFLGAVRDLSGEVVVFLPNLAPLVGEHAAAGDLLASALGRGELRAVAVATPEAFKKARDQGQELLRRFVPIDVEPATVDGTVTVLRGLVEGFEAAHGVRVGDPAVVAAAKLARRYVPSVALPKAAVDLLDEASALVRVTVESVPTELDALERRRTNLPAERRSLLDDTDPDSKDALAKIDAEVAALSPRIDTLHADWQRDLALLGAVRNAREEVHAAELELERAKGHGDDARARELTGSVLAGLERRLVEAEASLEATGSPLANFSVLPEHVAEVVAAWTGVPVAKMLEGEADKLLRMEA